MKTLLYIIRHGESLGNKARVCLGHTDLDLTDLGRLQAEGTARELSGLDVAKIYSSDLCRAMSTALPHAKMRGMEIVSDKNLRELYFGEWENMAIADIVENYGEKYTVEWREHFGTYTAPGGESVRALAVRMLSAVKKIAEENLGKTIIITSHAAAIRALFGEAYGIPAEELAAKLPFPSNASYSVLEYEEGTFTPLSYSNDAHLTEIFTTWKD